MNHKNKIELYSGPGRLPELSYGSWKALSIASQLSVYKGHKPVFDLMDLVGGLMHVDPTAEILNKYPIGQSLGMLGQSGFEPSDEIGLKAPMSGRVWRALILAGFRRVMISGYKDTTDPEDILMGLHFVRTANPAAYYLDQQGATFEKIRKDIKSIIRI